ncbi:uncharacterized protein CBL_00033 [Carabus blaptoides fortunei]
MKHGILVAFNQLSCCSIICKIKYSSAHLFLTDLLLRLQFCGSLKCDKKIAIVDGDVSLIRMEQFCTKPIHLVELNRARDRRPKNGWKTCNYCGKHISSSSNLHKHIFRMHSVQPILQCPLCRTPVKDKYSMRDHVRTQHGVRVSKSNRVEKMEFCEKS